jgi:hypothetical protein
MRAIHSPTTGGAWVLTMILVATACHSDPHPRSPGLARQLSEMALSAERDSLRMEVAANGKLLGDIETELARVMPVTRGTGPESTSLEVTKDQRAFALDRVREIATRLKQVDGRLAASERRVRRLTRTSDSLSQGLTGARDSITELGQLVASQQATVAILATQVEGLTLANLDLADSVSHLTDARNTAYFVAGTRDELLASGVLVPSGHRSVPLVGRRGVAPSRQLPLGEFTSIDRSAIRQIPLPHPDRRYRIVSRQNLAYLDEVGEHGGVRGSVSIREPEQFWEASPYLILVEQ